MIEFPKQSWVWSWIVISSGGIGESRNNVSYLRNIYMTLQDRCYNLHVYITSRCLYIIFITFNDPNSFSFYGGLCSPIFLSSLKHSPAHVQQNFPTPLSSQPPCRKNIASPSRFLGDIIIFRLIETFISNFSQILDSELAGGLHFV